MTAIKAD